MQLTHSRDPARFHETTRFFKLSSLVKTRLRLRIPSVYLAIKTHYNTAFTSDWSR